MSKTNKIIVILSVLLLLLIIVLGIHRFSGSVFYPALEAEENVDLLHWEMPDGSKFSIKKDGEKWWLESSLKKDRVEADEQKVSDLIKLLKRWDIEEISQPQTNSKGGKLKVYKHTRGGIYSRLKTYKWIKTDSNLYLHPSSKAYYKMKLPGFDADWDYLFGGTYKSWVNKWICNFFYYDIKRVVIKENGLEYSYDANAGSKNAGSENNSEQIVKLAAFKNVYFDRYINSSDSNLLIKSIGHKPLSVISIESMKDEVITLSVFSKKMSNDSLDPFQAYGILDKPNSKDTVLLSHLLVDKMIFAIKAD